MSEFHVQVVRLGKVGKHPGADTLSITQVNGYPVIFKTGEFQPGDLAVHIPVDAVVDTSKHPFEWLADKATSNGLYRVKGTKIRGVPSYGFLVPVDSQKEQPGVHVLGVGDEAHWVQEGQDVRHLLGVTKYDPGPCYDLQGQGEKFHAPQEGVVPFYDIEGFRKHQGLFEPDEQVVVTEKIHGANGRWVYLDGQLYCGSRQTFRKDSVWNQVAAELGLEKVLQLHPGLVLYGEVYGPGIQDLTYGAKKPKVAFFDAYDSTKGVWWSEKRVWDFCDDYGLPHVPLLYVGPFSGCKPFELAEGHSLLAVWNGVMQVREGVVIKPEKERWDPVIGRVFLKLPGEGYLLRKGGELSEYHKNLKADYPEPEVVTYPGMEVEVYRPKSWWTRFVDWLRKYDFID